METNGVDQALASFLKGLPARVASLQFRAESVVAAIAFFYYRNETKSLHGVFCWWASWNCCHNNQTIPR